MKSIRKITVLILALVLVASLCSCDLFSSGKSDDSNTGGQKVAKPEFTLALSNYQSLTAKRSDFDGKVVFTLYGKPNAKGSGSPYTAGQKVTMKRIQNGSKVYIDGEVGSCDLNGDMRSFLLSLKAVVGSFLSKKEADTVKNVIGYLDGTNTVSFLLGYDEKTTSYNFKGSIFQVLNKDVIKKDEVYLAVNDEYIQSFFDNKNIDINLELEKYLMFSTFVNFNKEAGWISKDTASGFFDTVNAVCNYQLNAASDKIYNYIVNTVENFFGSLDVAKYASDIRKYNECINIVKSWISMGESTVNATVNKDNLPVKMQTAIRINININIEQLIQVLNIIFEESTETIRGLINNIITSKFGDNTLSMSVDISFDETFKYNEKSVSLDDADLDLFIDAKEEKEGRISYIIREDKEETNGVSDDD